MACVAFDVEAHFHITHTTFTQHDNNAHTHTHKNMYAIMKMCADKVKLKFCLFQDLLKDYQFKQFIAQLRVAHTFCTVFFFFFHWGFVYMPTGKKECHAFLLEHNRIVVLILPNSWRVAFKSLPLNARQYKRSALYWNVIHETSFFFFLLSSNVACDIQIAPVYIVPT